jgi:hypothetical protein
MATGCSVTPPTPAGALVNCYVSSNCTGISCCLDDHLSGVGYQFSLEIRSCEEKLILTLERMTFTMSLFDYTMGTREVARLFGVLELE